MCDVDYLRRCDCMEGMADIPPKSVELVLADPPYGMTDCKWDETIDLEALWAAYRRLLRPNGTVLLFAQQPFSSRVVQSNPREYSCCWYWIKNSPTGFLGAHRRPLKNVEDILVFTINRPGSRGNRAQHKALRDYLLGELRSSGLTRAQVDRLLGNRMSSHYFTRGDQFSLPGAEDYAKLQRATGRFARPLAELQTEYLADGPGESAPLPAHNLPTYNPQGLQPCRIDKQNRKGRGEVYRYRGARTDYVQRQTGYPRQALYFPVERGLHPTQKPVALCEYLIRTYSNEGDLVLDNYMGSGTTCVAALLAGRHYIGLEQDEAYYQTALRRVEEAKLKRAA